VITPVDIQRNGTLPDSNRQAPICPLDKQSTCPMQRPGSFIRHRRGRIRRSSRPLEPIGRDQCACIPSCGVTGETGQRRSCMQSRWMFARVKSNRSSSATGVATENSFGPLVLGDRARPRTSKIRSSLLTRDSALFRRMGNTRRTGRHLWAWKCAWRFRTWGT
jgi:hypothetical protein